jgi:hypothetical protein
LASKRIRNPEYYDTKYAEVALVVTDKLQGTKSEDVRFTMTKDKALMLISGNK